MPANPLHPLPWPAAPAHGHATLFVWARRESRDVLSRALVVGHPLEHVYRDVWAPRIHEGASDVQPEIIARGLSG